MTRNKSKTEEVKILSTPGSLSDADLKLIVGTDALMSMMRNRLLLVIGNSESINWIELTQGIAGFYHIRKIDKDKLYQIWFEHAIDMETFKKNLTVCKLSETTHVD